jgi:SNF2-related domain/Helicase conserved C-terminal domain
MKLKLFQKQDLARAALKDGLILGWDTGLGKTWAMFLWPLLKVGFDRIEDTRHPEERIRPRLPVLIVAPGDLHQQIRDEARTKFGIITRPLSSQEAFDQLTRLPGSPLTNTTPDGRPVVPPGFYVTSYTQLASNGVAPLPDPYDWAPRTLLDWFSLGFGQHQQPTEYGRLDAKHVALPDSFADVCTFFAWRAIVWQDQYDLFNVSPSRSTLADVDHALDRELRGLEFWEDEQAAENQRKRLYAAYDVLKNLFSHKSNPQFRELNRQQQDWVIREFCVVKVAEYGIGIGEVKSYPVGLPPAGYDPEKPETDTRPKRHIKCVYSPSLADLCYNAFDCVVIDEGVKMKGETTIIGRGVRSMTPRYRLILTATPVKNRLPDIFRLAWWAAGGKSEATPLWPYRDESAERDRFAQTFMVTERNLTREEKAKEEGKKSSGGRFKKLTPEVCNVHRLWKLFGPLILRRRKDDTGVDIVPKVRRVIRCEMGTLQKKVYQYHLDADYRDIKGNPAIGAQLQALRIAAADPSSECLTAQPGEPAEPCECARAGAEPTLRCPLCKGHGYTPLPHRSGTAYIPKAATVLTLIAEILERREQVVVFSAFNDPLDNFARWLTEADVRHVLLDGRVSQKRRGDKAALFKQGRVHASSIPVMLAGVECMAEGHSFHLANNVILMAYSWAYDKFKQALDRVHRMNSVRPVNVYVVLSIGSIDRRLESLVQEKSDAAELVLDGRLIGERTEEVNLVELLKIAHREFNQDDATIDEGLLQAQWPALRQRLGAAMRQWVELPAADVQIPLRPVLALDQQPVYSNCMSKSPDRHDPLAVLSKEPVQKVSKREPEPVWRERPLVRPRVACVSADVWASL